MKFEFVEFYPTNKEFQKKNKKAVGTVHIYAIEPEMDIRGIRVSKNGKAIFFVLPHAISTDEEGNEVRYPFLRFTNHKTHQEMMDFLHKEVKPKIVDILRAKAD